MMPFHDLTFVPVGPEQWDDLESLFGERGACAGCWCMWWRVKRAEFERQQGEGNRQAMKQIVESGEVPGLLAYAEGQPVGWVSVAPREAYAVLGRSPTLKPVDDQPVWSVVCFFIARAYQRQGLSAHLLQAAIDYATAQGARIVEGYPVEPKKDTVPGMYAFTGFVSTFEQAGFVEVVRRSEKRPIMRYFVSAED